MNLSIIKGIIFITILSFLFSCEVDNTSCLDENSQELKEEYPISGWYDFPFNIKIDSGEIYKTISIKNEKGFYFHQREYLLNNKEVLLDGVYDEENADGRNPLFMKSLFECVGDLNQWILPQTSIVKIGEPLFFRNNGDKKWSSKIFLDKSKKIKDSLSVVSIIVDPNDLFNFNTGIYIQGTYGDIKDSKKGNYNQKGKEWEKDAVIHFFEQDGKLRFKSSVGLRIHGNLSRAQPQKSFRISFDKKHNSKPIKTSLFDNNQIIHRFILRTPFTSASQGQSILGDSFLGDLANDMGLDAMKSLPVNLYINGEYWGLYYLREKIDQYYFKEKYNVSKKSIDIVEYNRESKDFYDASYGNKEEWVQLMSFIKNNDVSNNLIYDTIASRIDINNLIDYLIIQTFFANKDWPANNFKVWKSNELDNKWRFIVYDLDATFRKDNMFKYLLSGIVKGNNIESSTFFFQKLAKNKRFKNKLIARYVFLSKTDFKSTELLSKLSEKQKQIELTINAQRNRWGMPDSQEKWEERLNKMKFYIKEREKVYKKHLKYFYNY